MLLRGYNITQHFFPELLIIFPLQIQFFRYFRAMQDHYQLLLTIYNIVKDDPQPQYYTCRPRELILRQLQDWSEIQFSLHELEKESLVHMEQQDTLIIRITLEGIERIKSLGLAAVNQ